MGEILHVEEQLGSQSHPLHPPSLILISIPTKARWWLGCFDHLGSQSSIATQAARPDPRPPDFNIVWTVQICWHKKCVLGKRLGVRGVLE